MRNKLLKVLFTLLISLAVTFPLTLIVPESYWWTTPVTTAIVASLIHYPISRWVDKNKDMIPK